MLGIEPKAVRVTWSVVLTLASIIFLYSALRTLVVFLLAVFFAYLLSPVVGLVDRFAKGRISRTLSLTIVYVVLIAVTGWDQDENRQRIVQAGFDAHLVKPVDPNAVVALLTARRRRSDFADGARDDVDASARVTSS